MSPAVEQVGSLGTGGDPRVVTTTVVLAAFLLGSYGVYRLGSRLKALVDDEALVEAIQSVVVTAFGTAAAVVLTEVWRLGDTVSTAFDAVVPGNPAEAGVKLMISLLVFGAAFTFTRVTKRVIKRESERDTITTHQKEIGHHVVQFLVFLPAFLFVVALWGTRPADLLLGAGAFGVVVGLAARQTLGSVLAGFVLLLARPFEIGDWVVVGEEEGTVTDVSVFNTEIRTFDNEHVLVPNENVANDEIVNRSRTDQLRLTVDVGIDYDVDVAEAAQIAEAAMTECDAVVDTPRPDVVMDQFGGSAVVLTLRFWIDDPTIQRKWQAQNAVVESVKRAFEREGVKIPYPQRELSGRPETDGLQVAPAREVQADDAGEESESPEPHQAAADGGPDEEDRDEAEDS
ncbi:mechanosensitive ion channel family protein [Salinirubellus salinus]|uniref:Mechanosensitive ion channel family protein n=1 Tax=Salinirubellus salinus TaxID=1364945 RepID=A0A9E7R4N9_9EURY|nr:mechanosensitive ion channel family protein [Salinirubellus salinus]UWM55805.1 mechanosensitive ion channel family protein [Salinirubellus salinus]